MNKRNLTSLIVLAVGIILLGGIFFMLSSDKHSETENAWRKVQSIQEYFNSAGEPEVYAWNQSVTLEVEVDGVQYSDTTVMKVVWSENTEQVNDQMWIPAMYGEMPFVELPDGSVIASLNKNSLKNLAEHWLIDHTRNLGAPSEDDLKNRVRQTSVLGSEDDAFPHLVIFSDPKNVETISYFENESAILRIEKTSLATTEVRVPEVFPWLTSLETRSVRSMSTSFTKPNGAIDAAYKQDFYLEDIE